MKDHPYKVKGTFVGCPRSCCSTWWLPTPLNYVNNSSDSSEKASQWPTSETKVRADLRGNKNKCALSLKWKCLKTNSSIMVHPNTWAQQGLYSGAITLLLFPYLLETPMTLITTSNGLPMKEKKDSEQIRKRNVGSSFTRIVLLSHHNYFMSSL